MTEQEIFGSSPRSKRRDRRAEFIQAAESLFAELGYEGTTVRDITSKAGSSVGLLFNYFPNGKEEILVELVRRRGPQSLVAIEPVLNSQESFSSVILNYHLFEFEYHVKNKDLHKIILEQSLLRPETLELWKEIILQRRIIPIANFLTHRQNLGEIPQSVNIDVASRLLFKLAHHIGFFEHCILGEERERCLKLLEEAADYFCEWIQT